MTPTATTSTAASTTNVLTTDSAAVAAAANAGPGRPSVNQRNSERAPGGVPPPAPLAPFRDIDGEPLLLPTVFTGASSNYLQIASGEAGPDQVRAVSPDKRPIHRMRSKSLNGSPLGYASSRSPRLKDGGGRPAQLVTFNGGIHPSAASGLDGDEDPGPSSPRYSIVRSADGTLPLPNLSYYDDRPKQSNARKPRPFTSTSTGPVGTSLTDNDAGDEASSKSHSEERPAPFVRTLSLRRGSMRKRGKDTGSESSLVTSKDNIEFHKLFRTIPNSELLVDDFACAFRKDRPVRGRLWVSQRHLCFASFFSTKFLYPITSIAEIQKKDSGFFHPNAIEIELTDGQILHFSSFFDRDQVLQLLRELWNLHVDRLSPSRKFPDISTLECTCGNAKTCEFCVLQDQISVKRRQETTQLVPSVPLAAPAMSPDFYATTLSLGRPPARKSRTDNPRAAKPLLFKSDTGSSLTVSVSNETAVGGDSPSLTPSNSVATVAAPPQSELKSVLSVDRPPESVQDTPRSTPEPASAPASVRPPLDRHATPVSPIASPSGEAKRRGQSHGRSHGHHRHPHLSFVHAHPTGPVDCGDGLKHASATVVYDGILPVSIEHLKDLIYSHGVKGEPVRLFDGVATASDGHNGDGVRFVPASAGFFIPFLYEYRKVKDFTISKWTSPNQQAELQPPDSVTNDVLPMVEGIKGWYRRQEYIMPMTHPLGPKQTRAIIKEEVVKAKNHWYICARSFTRNPDIFDGIFQSNVNMCMMYVSPLKTKMVISVTIDFDKFTMLKSPILMGAIDGVRQSYRVLESVILEKHKSNQLPAPAAAPAEDTVAPSGASHSDTASASGGGGGEAPAGGASATAATSSSADETPYAQEQQQQQHGRRRPTGAAAAAAATPTKRYSSASGSAAAPGVTSGGVFGSAAATEAAAWPGVFVVVLVLFGLLMMMMNVWLSWQTAAALRDVGSVMGSMRDALVRMHVELEAARPPVPPPPAAAAVEL
ncbi:hypothetical protein DFJ73DRAFT_958638 [Zopfochytrium polystomum]|nr:hypothetical protein DFJ73DRAFT_958638 [Zopfochytrium polystomum]